MPCLLTKGVNASMDSILTSYYHREETVQHLMELLRNNDPLVTSLEWELSVLEVPISIDPGVLFPFAARTILEIILMSHFRNREVIRPPINPSKELISSLGSRLINHQPSLESQKRSPRNSFSPLHSPTHSGLSASMASVGL